VLSGSPAELHGDRGAGRSAQLAIVNCRGTHSDLSRSSSGRIQNCQHSCLLKAFRAGGERNVSGRLSGLVALQVMVELSSRRMFPGEALQVIVGGVATAVSAGAGAAATGAGAFSFASIAQPSADLDAFKRSQDHDCRALRMHVQNDHISQHPARQLAKRGVDFTLVFLVSSRSVALNDSESDGMRLE